MAFTIATDYVSQNIHLGQVAFVLPIKRLAATVKVHDRAGQTFHRTIERQRY